MRLEKELDNLINPKRSELRGSLGLSPSTVKVSTRPGYVWVRLSDNINEAVKAHNSRVSSTYGLPVVVAFDGIKYEIVRVDTDRYADWTTDSPFLVDHATQHSAMRGAEGNDIVWVDSQQFLPLLVAPVGLTGTLGITIGPYNYFNTANRFMSVGATGLYGFNPIDPVNSNMYLVMLNDQTGNFYALTGTATFSPNITGSADVFNYVPTPGTLNPDRPLAAIKATPGVGMNWNAIYDARQIYAKPTPSISSVVGDLVTSGGSGIVTGTIPNQTIDNAKLADMTGPVVLGRVTGTGAPEYLSPTDLLNAGLGVFGGAVEAVNEAPDGVRTHFTFNHVAADIWVLVTGINLITNPTFTKWTSSFDLSFAPLVTDTVQVIRLAPVTPPPINDYILVREEKPAGTDGGTFTSGAWQIRTINAEISDPGGHCSLPGSNIIRLEAGTYRYTITAPGFRCGAHKLRLYNVTAGAEVPNSEGTSEFTPGGYDVQSVALLEGMVVLTVQTDLRVEHRCEATRATKGMGIASNFATKEIYTVAKFIKVA